MRVSIHNEVCNNSYYEDLWTAYAVLIAQVSRNETQICMLGSANFFHLRTTLLRSVIFVISVDLDSAYIFIRKEFRTTRA